MKLELELRPSYGENRYYPKNEASRALIETLMGRTCLRDLDLIVAASIGATLIIFDKSGELIEELK